MKKHVCMVVQSYYPQDIRVLKMALAAKSNGHRVSVISIRNLDQPRRESIDGVNVYRMKLNKNRGSSLRYLFEYITFSIYAFFKLNLIDLTDKINVVHINNLPDFLVFSAIIQKLKRSLIILDMHEIWPEFCMSKFNIGKNHPVVRILIFIEKVSLLFADKIITVNDPIKNVFHKRTIPDKPITVIMNTVDESLVPQIKKRAHKSFSCVYHGTLTDLYGLDTAIIGFSKACLSIPDITFNIFGVGPSMEKLGKLSRSLGIEKHVIFHGLLSHDKMMDALSEMDLGILSSPKDIFLDLSFSNKLAEYMFLRIPVISSDLDTTKYYFSEKHVLFFKSGDIEDLGAKILYAYNNKDIIDAMANNAFEKIQTLSWTIMAKRYLELINRKFPD